MAVIRGTQKHPFHLVKPSIWPLLTSISLLILPIGFVLYFQYFRLGSPVLLMGIIAVIYSLKGWFQDIIKEATYERQHTKAVQHGIRMGFILFIASEVMFFFSFFWAFFHASLSPSIQIGSIWPPKGIAVIYPWGIPLYNTCVLLYSGLSVTLAHHAIVHDKQNVFYECLEITIHLGIIFTLFQAYEYVNASYTISDSVYGSLFYLMTGFHGIHVLVGTIFLAVCLYRAQFGHFSSKRHVGFELAAWYWHFVDVVWLFLFVCLYWWGGK